MPAFTSIAAAAALAASAAGAGIAGSKRRKAARKQRRILRQMEDDNENMFLKDYYKDFMDDPSSKAYLKRIEKNLYDKNEGVENSAVATGATHENVLAQKQANNEVMSDAINNVVINHEQKKDAAKERYLNRKDAIVSGNLDLIGQQGEQQAQNWSNLGNNMSDSINGLSSAYLQSGGRLLGSGPGAVSLNKAGLNQVTGKSLDYADDLKRKSIVPGTFSKSPFTAN